jgi:hypothetical protein
MKKLAFISIALLINVSNPAGASAPSHHKEKIHHQAVRVIPRALTKWDTRKTDSTASWPDKTDPTWKMPLRDQEVFACIRYHESRNHLNDGVYSQGWYQFTPYIWSYARTAIKGLPAIANSATGDQQSAVAVFYFKRNGTWAIEWAADQICWS